MSIVFRKKRTREFSCQTLPCGKLRALNALKQRNAEFQISTTAQASNLPLPIPGHQQGTDQARLITILLQALNVPLRNMIMTMRRERKPLALPWPPADGALAASQGPLSAGQG